MQWNQKKFATPWGPLSIESRTKLDATIEGMPRMPIKYRTVPGAIRWRNLGAKKIHQRVDWFTLSLSIFG